MNIKLVESKYKSEDTYWHHLIIDGYYEEVKKEVKYVYYKNGLVRVIFPNRNFQLVGGKNRTMYGTNVHCILEIEKNIFSITEMDATYL